jgi:hypothetical protein
MLKRNKLRESNQYVFNKSDQWKTRERGFFTGSRQIVNSDPIFNHKDMKKKTKGYDIITGEIEKRGKPADNQEEIFVKKPEKEKDFKQRKREKDKNDAKRREALNKKLYRDRLKTRWDRGW